MALEVYRNDVVVEYSFKERKKKSRESKRGEIVKLSRDSLARLAFVANNTAADFEYMVTLTYPMEFPSDGATVKKNLNRFLSWVRSCWEGVGYLWFLEFQKRGAPHIHILLTVPLDREKVSERWYKAVGSEDEKHLAAGTRVEKLRSTRGGARYVTKYAQKAKQKHVPKEYRNCGRFWGHSRNVKPESMMKIRVMQRGDEFVQSLDFWDYKMAIQQRPLKTLFNMSTNEGFIRRITRGEKDE